MALRRGDMVRVARFVPLSSGELVGAVIGTVGCWGMITRDYPLDGRVGYDVLVDLGDGRQQRFIYLAEELEYTGWPTLMPKGRTP